VHLTGHRPDAAHLPEQPLVNFNARAFVRRIELPGLAAEILQDRTGFEDRDGTPAGTLRIDDRRHAVVRGDLQEVRIELFTPLKCSRA
jgi:hypothetical protein